MKAAEHGNSVEVENTAVDSEISMHVEIYVDACSLGLFRNLAPQK